MYEGHWASATPLIVGFAVLSPLSPRPLSPLTAHFSPLISCCTIAAKIPSERIPIRTAVLGAGLLIFTLSLDEIAVTFFLIGRQNTLPLQIWGLLRRGITPQGNAAATVIFLLSVVAIVIWARLMGEDRSG